MGVTINKRKSTGDWYVWISHKGKRASRKIGKSYSNATMAAKEYEKKLILGEFDFTNSRGKSKDELLFGDFCDDYIKNVAKHRLKYNSWNSYQKIIDLYLKPEWEKRILISITRQDVKKLLFKKQADGIIISNIKICISAIFAEAIERDILSVNPAHNLGRCFKKNNPQKKTQFLSKEQAAALLELAKQEKPEYYDMLLTAFRTGMRMG